MWTSQEQNTATVNLATAFRQRVHWEKDRLFINDLVFRLELYRDDQTWELGDNCFVFYKIPELLEEYFKFFGMYQNFSPQNILEIGLWEGGSLPFWFEFFQPQKLIGLDIAEREDSAYFKQYLAERGLERRLQTYWGIDATDRERVVEIVQQEFDSKLDLVFDDASHVYGDTKTSFEILFPLLRPGGLYIIEDWAWGHWNLAQWSEQPIDTEPTRFIFELVEAVGTSNELISNIYVSKGFTVIERGEKAILEPENFKLEDFVVRRSNSLEQRYAALHEELKSTVATLEEQLKQAKREQTETKQVLARFEKDLRDLQQTRTVQLTRQIGKWWSKLR